MNIFLTKAGVTLHLQSLNPDAISYLYQEMGFYDALAQIGDFDGTPGEWAQKWDANLGLESKIQATEKIEQLFNYCCGWGVSDDPPANAVEELKIIGLETSSPRIARINWLRFLLLEEEETGLLIGSVMALSQMERIKRMTGE